ncbi:hypothetical protein J437_LFUL002292 [Ladona fulva]|uniref:Uncharacterized protein n=1 Tax=Ladona fulva TaxID=123851 RepID=A0A8K0JWV7_LADFU|nr:hypothetical protein J437_LFUL002292 [Ladona fulva]
MQANLSKNRFSELPRDVTEFSSLEELGLYHNAIRSLPQSVSQLQSLTYLDLSRNQLTHLPGGLCSLPLKVLRVANNKLNALPLDLPRLGPTLEELDADCNEIASLPPHVGQLPALRSLRLRRNLLTYLPVEITYLRLVRLDISENRISSLPVELRKMTTLVTLELSDNPLISPPASRCTRGRVHIFKYLESQALKDDKRKGVVTLTPNEESKLRRHRKPDWQKRYTADSGYNTSDGVDNKSWSSDVRLSSISTEDDLDGGLTMGKIRADQSQTNKPGSLPVTNGGGVGASCFSGTSTPSTISPGESYMDLEEELAKIRMSESKDGAEEVVENGRRRKGSGAGSFQEGSGKRTVGHVRFNSNGSNGVNGDSPEHFASGMQASNVTDSSDPLRNNPEGKKCLEHIQTYR